MYKRQPEGARGASAPLISDISKVIGGAYTISISADQRESVYLLAGSARTFTTSVAFTIDGMSFGSYAATGEGTNKAIKLNSTFYVLNITGGNTIGILEVNEAASLIAQAADADANIIFGATFSEDFEDEMRVTVIATGFDEKKPESKGIYSSSKPAAGSKQQSIPADAASDINDIDEIFKIFNK